MIHDYKVLGGVVDPTKMWVNRFYDSLFHEIGTYPATWAFNEFPWETAPLQWRASFTPTTAGKVLVAAILSKHRVGNGGGHRRLYTKGRIVQVLPTYNPDLASYAEAIWEGVDAFPYQLRYLDSPMPLLAVATVAEEAVGQVHTFAVEQLSGDGMRSEVCFGALMVISG